MGYLSGGVDQATVSAPVGASIEGVMKSEAIIAAPTAIRPNSAIVPTKAKPKPTMKMAVANRTALDKAVLVFVIRVVILVSPVSSFVSMIKR